ncbi:hypothetical protein LguiA_001918 [Lonicera macranthoides]
MDYRGVQGEGRTQQKNLILQVPVDLKEIGKGEEFLKQSEGNTDLLTGGGGNMGGDKVSEATISGTKGLSFLRTNMKVSKPTNEKATVILEEEMGKQILQNGKDCYQDQGFLQRVEVDYEVNDITDDSVSEKFASEINFVMGDGQSKSVDGQGKMERKIEEFEISCGISPRALRDFHVEYTSYSRDILKKVLLRDQAQLDRRCRKFSEMHQEQEQIIPASLEENLATRAKKKKEHFGVLCRSDIGKLPFRFDWYEEFVSA